MRTLKLLKLAVAAGVVSFCSADAMGQQTYLKTSVGYSIGTDYNAGVNQNKQDRELAKLAYGKGINAAIAGGYMFDSHIGIELGASYLLGSKNNVKQSNEYYNGNSISTTTIESSSYSRMYMLKPAFVLTAGRTGINPYGAFGPVLSTGKIYQTVTLASTTKQEVDQEYKGGVSVGGHAVFGIEINDNSNNTFFLEATLNSLSHAPKKTVLTRYEEDGKDKLAQMSVREREAEFKTNVNYNPQESPDKPTQLLKVTFPLSSIGLHAGIRFKL